MRVSLPLQGFKVLSLAHAWAAPYGAMMLADMGAEVVMVEVPGVGDHTRNWTRTDLKGVSPHFVSVNRNKRSIQIDLRTEEGREVALKLAAEADAIIENFAPGKLAKYGLDYEGVKAVNPELVYASVSGYGAAGPDSERRAYDLLLQAESGIMSVTGGIDGVHSKVGVPISDVAAAMIAAFSLVCGLVDQLRNGKGANIDISMLEVSSSLMAFNVVDYSVSGHIARPLGTEHPLLAPYRAFETATSPVVICILTNQHWEIFKELVGRPELDDRRFDTAPLRVDYREPLNELLSEVFTHHDQDHWIEKLNEAGLACGRVRDVEDVINHPQHLERDFFERHTAQGVEFTMPGRPWAYGESRTKPSEAPPERPGMHSRQVLADWLGLDQAEIDALEQAGGISEAGGDPVSTEAAWSS
jgi:crotonobetainyl-CoA:carnitine CoA-transferase CaiB-like acyl-CoA transferase